MRPWYHFTSSYLLQGTALGSPALIFAFWYDDVVVYGCDSFSNCEIDVAFLIPKVRGDAEGPRAVRPRLRCLRTIGYRR
jgi:hypothetical protein